MARGSIRKRGKTWSAQAPNGRHPDGRRRWATKGGLNTRKQAEQELARMLGEISAGMISAICWVTASAAVCLGSTGGSG